jgi:nitrate/nitrite-specific signal transduction histidine kinase
MMGEGWTALGEGAGIRGMRERAILVGADLRIEPGTEGGTEVRLTEGGTEVRLTVTAQTAAQTAEGGT